MGKYKKRKDGRYATSVTLGHDANGKVIKVFLSAKTEAELKRKVIQTQVDAQSGKILKESSMLLKDYAKDWLSLNKAKSGINTKAMYENAVNKHIILSIGHIPISKVKKSDVQKMINDRWEHPRTCQIIRMTLTQILESAIEDKLINDNVCKKLTMPKNEPKEKRQLTDEEKEAIKKADFSGKEKMFVYILFYFGLRRGEALALSKSDIDLKNNILIVNKSIAFNKNDPVLKDTKSKSGVRNLPIPNAVKSILRDYLKQCDTFYLFADKGGNLLTQSMLVRMWERIIRKMNEAVCTEKELLIGNLHITGLTPHIFRHNYCTMLYYSGISQKKAVELMGHSDVTMIMRVYAHLDEEKEKVQEKLNNAINL